MGLKSLPKNQRQRRCCGDHVPASNSLNEPRPCPIPRQFGQTAAKRSRKVLRSQKRSPAPAATERRAKGKSSQAGTTRAALRSQARERHFFSGLRTGIRTSASSPRSGARPRHATRTAARLDCSQASRRRPVRSTAMGAHRERRRPQEPCQRRRRDALRCDRPGGEFSRSRCVVATGVVWLGPGARSWTTMRRASSSTSHVGDLCGGHRSAKGHCQDCRCRSRTCNASAACRSVASSDHRTDKPLTIAGTGPRTLASCRITSPLA